VAQVVEHQTKKSIAYTTMARINSHTRIVSPKVPHRQSFLGPLLSLLLLLTVTFSPFVAVQAEDADVVQAFTGNYSSNNSSATSSSSSSTPFAHEEATVLIFFCTLYAICVSVVAVGLAYFAFLEDKMMRLFLKHGHALQSTVVSADFSRGAVATCGSVDASAPATCDDQGVAAAADPGCCYTCGALQGCPSSGALCTAAAAATRDHEDHHQEQQNSQQPLVIKAEYNVVIEYKVDKHDNYKSKVRKQVKALGGDFTKPIPPCILVEMIEFPIDVALSPVPPPYSSDTNTSSGKGEHHRQQQQLASDLQKLKQHHQCSAITSHLIPILVLEDYPKSAIPQGHVHRACSWKYKLSTVTLVAILLAFAGFCLLLAADVMYPTSLLSLKTHYGSTNDDMLVAAAFSRGHVFMLVGLILLGLVLVEVASVHYFMGKTLSDSIRETYLEGVDQGSVSMDDTTLSSGDDTYLMV
jgi:hypothetical protein